MSVTEETERKIVEADEMEIRLVDFILFFKKNRRRILLGALIGLFVGALYAFSKPNMYTAQVTVLPEIQSRGASSLGNLGSLAGLAGINLDNISGQDAIRPDLYPTVLQSVPFALDALKQPVYSQKFQEKMTLQAFIERLYSTSLLNNVFSVEAKNNNSDNVRLDPKNFSQAIQFTKEQEKLIKWIQESVSAAYDKKTGIITITAVEPDPVVAATIARLSLDYLTKYITTYRTEKSRKQVDFLKQQVREAEYKYQTSEYALSSYRDRNRSLFLNTAKIEEQRLQADYLLTQSVYSELSKQLEQAKIKVQEETPVFKILEPATVPLRKSGPKRTLVMLGFATVGILVSLVFGVTRLIQAKG